MAWTSPANLRIPLRYLGHLEVSIIPAILDPLRELVSPLPPLRIQIGPLTAFPSPERARLVIAQVNDPSGTLPELATRLDALLDRLGMPASQSPFQPHFTLVRLQDPCDVQAWLASVELPLLEARLTECSIHRHTQSRPGGEHVAFDRIPLAPQSLRSQRPSKAPKASQRPSRRPPRTADAAPARQDIPAPPRMPSFDPTPAATASASPAPAPEQPQPQQPAPAPTPSSPASPRSSILPPAPDGLPPEDDWG